MVNRIFIGIIILALLPGCAKKEGADVVATVNGQPIYLKEFQRELSIKLRQDPSLELNEATLYALADTLVKRQLIVQEAMERKMAEEPRFVDTIKAFWEQTLIRDFIEYKSREFEQYIFVSDKEIDSYYNGLLREVSDMPPLKDVYGQLRETLRQQKKARAFEDWLKKEEGNSKVQIDKDLISAQVIK